MAEQKQKAPKKSKEERQKEHAGPRTVVVDIDNQQIKFTWEMVPQIVERKVKHPDGIHNLRNEEGAVIKLPAEVPGMKLSVEFPDGTVWQTRSCCKPPDKYKQYMGIFLAFRRALHQNDAEKQKLTQSQRTKIMRTICPSIFRDPARLKRQPRPQTV